jgi:hypothetical protein
MLLDEVAPTPMVRLRSGTSEGDIMDRTILHRLADALLRAGMDRSVARQQFEKSLAGVHPGTPGHAQAMQVARSAALFESALLWLGWRLQPRSAMPELLDRT